MSVPQYQLHMPKRMARRELRNKYVCSRYNPHKMNAMDSFTFFVYRDVSVHLGGRSWSGPDSCIDHQCTHPTSGYNNSEEEEEETQDETEFNQ